MTVASALASFALVAGVLTIIPGLDTAMVLRSAVSGGRRHGFATALGIGTGSLLWGVAAAVGASALLTASHLAYDALRIAGALYLLWMGLAMLRGAPVGGLLVLAVTPLIWALGRYITAETPLEVRSRRLLLVTVVVTGVAVLAAVTVLLGHGSPVRLR